MEERYLSIREVAKIIGVTPLTLRNWDRRGVLQAVRNPFNNYRMYRYSEIENFLGGLRRAEPAGPVVAEPVSVTAPKVQRLTVRLERDPASAEQTPLEENAPQENPFEGIEVREA